MFHTANHDSVLLKKKLPFSIWHMQVTMHKGEKPNKRQNIKSDKKRVFALRAASALIWAGGGWGLAVPFYFVQDCSSGIG